MTIANKCWELFQAWVSGIIDLLPSEARDLRLYAETMNDTITEYNAVEGQNRNKRIETMYDTYLKKGE